MRIAYLTQSYPPMVSGASIVAEQLATGMANLGHEVLVIAASDNGKRYFTQKKNLTVLRLNSIQNPLRVNQRSILFPQKILLQTLQEFQPDLIHTHEPLQVGLVGIRYAKDARIPILLTAHQLPWFITSYLPNISILKKLVEKIVWKYAHWIIKKFTCVTSPTKTISKIVKSKTGLKPITLNYGVDLETFHPHPRKEDEINFRVKFNIPNDAPIILHVGRLDADKLVDRVIFAAADVIKKSDAHLLIVGDGKEKQKLMGLCKSLGIESQTHFTGFISQKCELAKIYRTATVFVTASEIETQGIVLLEAAACGLPLVAVNATCISEVVWDGINGYLAESDDRSGLSEAIEKILKNPECTKMMKKQAQLMAEKYSFGSTLTKHEKLYLRILGQIVTKPILLSRFSQSKILETKANVKA